MSVPSPDPVAASPTPVDSVSCPDPSSDHALVDSARAGDQAAAGELYARYGERVRALVAQRIQGRVSARVGADDIAQSVFRTFFQGVAERAYSVPADRELWGLLCVLALSKVRERMAYHRAARRDIRRTTPTPDGDLDRLAGEDAGAHQLGLEVDDLLNAFHPSDREVLGLRMTGHELTEIAAKTGRSLRTVERVLHKARTRLRELLT
jgi:RNA polymerase sigma-70 factor (ECF subfamily)